MAYPWPALVEGQNIKRGNVVSEAEIGVELNVICIS